MGYSPQCLRVGHSWGTKNKVYWWHSSQNLPVAFIKWKEMSLISVQFSRSVMCDSLRPHDCSTPGLPVHHQLPEFTQTHVHWVGDDIQPSHLIIQYARNWKTQQWPQDWKRSVFIPIPKKGNAKECSSYRTIALISMLVMLKILQARVQHYVNCELSDV